MAHLTKCWCGKTYRCEKDHSPPPGVISCFDLPEHVNCPDFSLHGPTPGTLAFYSVASEKFVDPEEELDAQPEHQQRRPANP